MSPLYSTTVTAGNEEAAGNLGEDSLSSITLRLSFPHVKINNWWNLMGSAASERQKEQQKKKKEKKKTRPIAFDDYIISSKSKHVQRPTNGNRHHKTPNGMEFISYC